MAPRAQPLLDIVDRRLGLVETAMGHQPTRRFRQPQPHEEDHQPECGADEEGKPPAQIRRQQIGIEQHDRAGGAERSADPEAAVDDEIGPAAIARRHQLLDGGIDGSVFAADAGAGEEAKQREAPEIPRQRGCRCGDEIERERDEEQALAPEPIGEPAEEDRTQHRAGEIGAARDPDVGVRELELMALLERRRDRAGERHLEAVEDPGDAERHHHQGVEAAPPQAVKARRDVGGDHPCLRFRAGAGRRRQCRHGVIISRAPIKATICPPPRSLRRSVGYPRGWAWLSCEPPNVNAASGGLLLATTHARCRRISVTRTSSTPCATPSLRRTGSKTSGADH
jgi:hypothetical protein